MTKEKSLIVDELLKNFDYDRKFETEHFLYWVKDRYMYSGKDVSRDEFKAAKDYVVKHGTLPFISLNDKLEKIRQENIKQEKNDNSPTSFYKAGKPITNTHSVETFLRYSKKYDNLEFYMTQINVKTSHRNSSNRIMVFKKKHKYFSINSKNYVLIRGNRWMSIKNWISFSDKTPFVTYKFSKMLLKLMLGGLSWIDDLKSETLYISNKNSRNTESLNEAFENECGAKPVKIIKRALKNNKNDIINLYSFIDPNQIHNLTNFIKRNHQNINKLIDSKFRSYPVEAILYFYFVSKDTRLKDNEQMFLDFLRMSKEEGNKINLNISSYRTIRDKHDELSEIALKRNRDKGRLKVSKVYPKINSTKEIGVEQIRSAQRLQLESEILHHCVHSYKSNVNKGSSCIYSLVFNDERYTLEVRAKEKEKEKDKEEVEYDLSAVQLKGRYNCDAPFVMKEYVESICDEYGITLSRDITFEEAKMNVSKYSEKVDKNKSVNQLGESVLELLIRGSEVNNGFIPF